MKIQVYADILFLINFCMNYVVLILCKKLLHVETKQWKIILAAVLGGVYSVCIFYPTLEVLYTVLFKLGISFVMVIISFPVKKIKDMLMRIGTFYIVNFVLGGACMALFYLTDVGGKTSAIVKNGAFYLKLPMWILLCSTTGVYIMITAVTRFLKNRHGRQKYDVTIALSGEKIEVRGFLDTGNCLTEPMSGKPVLVAAWSVLKELFPVGCTRENFAMYIPPERLKMIPYKTVGKEKGVLWAIRVDYVQFSDKKIEKVLVGIYEGELSDEYDLLLHRGLMI